MYAKSRKNSDGCSLKKKNKFVWSGTGRSNAAHRTFVQGPRPPDTCDTNKDIRLEACYPGPRSCRIDVT